MGIKAEHSLHLVLSSVDFVKVLQLRSHSDHAGPLRRLQVRLGSEHVLLLGYLRDRNKTDAFTGSLISALEATCLRTRIGALVPALER